MDCRKEHFNYLLSYQAIYCQIKNYFPPLERVLFDPSWCMPQQESLEGY